MKFSLQRQYFIQIFVLILLVLACIAGFSAYYSLHTLEEISSRTSSSVERELEEEIMERGQALVSYVSESLVEYLYLYDIQTISELLKSVIVQDDVQYLLLYDKDGEVIQRESLPAWRDIDPFRQSEVKMMIAADSMQVYRGTETMNVAMPVRLGDERLGLFLVAYDAREIERDVRRLNDELAEISRQMQSEFISTLLIIGILLVGISYGLSYLVSSRLVGPIRKLQDWARKVGQSRFDIGEQIERSDEIGELAESFREMSTSLEQTQERFLEKQMELEQTIAELDLEVDKRKEIESQITNRLKEREILLAEIHHRVKNNLQIISSLFSMQARQITGENAGEILRGCRARVESMSLIHEKLYMSANLSQIDFQDYLNSLACELMSTYQVDPSRIRLKLDVDQAFLEIDRAIPCAMIASELITNALKHAYPDQSGGDISLRFHSLGPRFRLTVCDSGPGMAGDAVQGASGTLGMKLVRSLVKQIDGRMEIENRGGLRVEIDFPVNG